MWRCMCLALAFAVSGAALGQSQRTWVIDFEGLAASDSTPLKLTNQYAVPPYSSYGVTFSIAGSATLSPVIAVTGSPKRAYENDAGQNDPKFASGDCAMTDAVNGNDISVTGDIQMDFNPPVTGASFYLIDIDGAETYKIRSFSGQTELTNLEQNLSASSQFAGDGLCTIVRIRPGAGQKIDRVVIDTKASPGGFAVDFLTFTRDCDAGQGHCPRPRLRLSQESAPGAGDFDAHPLGVAAYFLSDADVKSLYAYNVPDNDAFYGSQVDPIVNRTHTWVTTTSSGIALITVHDRPAAAGGNGGGAAEMRIAFANGRGEGCAKADWAVKDDPDDKWYAKEVATCSFKVRHNWNPTNSDGFAIGGVDPTSSVFISFDDVDGNSSNGIHDNLNEWFWYTPSGAPIQLSNDQGRRVRLNLVPPCAADFNLDAFLTFEDFDSFVGYFEAGADLADFNADGFLTFEDFDEFVSEFEVGC